MAARDSVPARQGATAHAFEIRVPRRYDVELHSAGGGLILRDLDGIVRGEAGGGGIEIERLHGRAELASGGGRIRGRDSELDGLITTGGGEISVVNTRGTLRTSSSSASAREEVRGERPSPAADDSKVVRIRQSGGAISLAEVSTGGGDIRIGRASGAIHASTGGGNIAIGPVSGSLIAGTGKGNVQVTIARLDAGVLGAEIGSGLGAVVVEIAPDVSATLELETAYTNTLGRRTKIDSSWTLVEDETSEWDTTRGTPRKYIRARGQVGNGGALIRVSTVNGDITVRRRAE